MPDPTLQQIQDARNEMIFREEQLHSLHSAEEIAIEIIDDDCGTKYDKARDAYLTLLMEYRVAQLKEVPA